MAIAQVVPIFEASQNLTFQTCPIATNQEPGVDISDDYAAPSRLLMVPHQAANMFAP